MKLEGVKRTVIKMHPGTNNFSYRSAWLVSQVSACRAELHLAVCCMFNCAYLGFLQRSHLFFLAFRKNRILDQMMCKHKQIEFHEDLLAMSITSVEQGNVLQLVLSKYPACFEQSSATAPCL